MKSGGSGEITGRLAAGVSLVLGSVLAMVAGAPAEGLRDFAQKRGLAIGAAAGGTFWGGDARYRETLAREFNMVVAENAMKFDQLEPSRGQFEWAQADSLAAFAARNGMALRGHNFVWYQQSKWLEAAGDLPRAEMLAILKNHIDQVAGHFAGKVAEWDVVNEAVADDGSGLRDSFWRKRIGDDYIDSAYAWAHRADPKALLFYNDYSGEGAGAKSDRIYALVKGLKERGIPIHGVGMQCHFQCAKGFPTAAISTNMKRLGALGLSVTITELDFRVKLPADSAALALQRDNYASLLRTCLENANCKSFLTWGFTDAYSWVPGFFQGEGAALPFDAAYAPKPAYAGMLGVLGESIGIRKTGGRPRTGGLGNVRVTLGGTLASGWRYTGPVEWRNGLGRFSPAP